MFHNMSLRNKIRNIRIFGFNNNIPKIKYVLIALIIIIISFTVFKITNNETPKITGMAIDIEEEYQPPQEIIEEESFEEEIEPGWWEYKEECSFNIGNAEDDVNDITNYMNEYQIEYDELENDYNKKLQELEEEYEHPLQLLQEKLDDAQENLNNAQSKVDEFRNQCAY